MNATEDFDRCAIPVYIDVDGAEAIPPEYRGRRVRHIAKPAVMSSIDNFFNTLLSVAEERGEIKPYIQKIPKFGDEQDG